MKIRRSVFWFAAIVAVSVLLVIWFGKKQPADTPLAVSTETNAAPTAPTAPSLSVNTPVHTNALTVDATPVPSEPKLSPGSKAERKAEILSTYNDQPIVFYGKIEDQFSNAVAGALVNFGVRIINGYESTVKRGQVVSDANGLFTISGYKGQDLGIGAEKPGYAWVSMNGSGIYSRLYPEEQRAHPDINNPVIIKMWKLQGGEPLIHFSFNRRIPYDGKPVIFDFHTGQIVNTGGDLIIRLQCPLTPDTREQYDWQADIQPVEGGIVSNNERLELMFQAPDSGYEPEFDIKNEKDTKPWSSTFHGGFYFKSHGGNTYGKFDLGIVIYAIKNGLVPITIDGYINPADSRNLQIDPAMVTSAHP